MWFSSCSVWQVPEVAETGRQNFEGNSQVLSGQLFAIQHFWPSLTGNVHSDGSCTSLPSEHLLFLLQVHEAKFLEKLTGTRKVKKISHYLWNQNVHYNVHTSLLCVPVLSLVSPVHIFPSYFFMMHFSIILPLIPRSSRWALSIWFPHQNLVPPPPLRKC